MNKNKFTRTLSRWLSGKANETEKALVDAWYRSYEDDERQTPDEERRQLKERLLNNINASIDQPKIRRLTFLRVAACIAILVSATAVYFLYNNNKTQPALSYYTVTTATGGIKQLTLPDSSVIWLNAKSSIRIPVNFDPARRDVELLEGEAFFDVKHKTTQPFVVKAGQLGIQVLGTSFNVRNYKSLKETDVTVTTGKVGITRDHKTLAMLLPGQQFGFNTLTAKYQQHKVSTTEAQGWRDGNTYLTQANFSELALVIKNIYGVDLKPGTPEVNKYRFTLRLQHSLPATQVLKMISQMHSTHYRKEGTQIVMF